MRSTRGHLLTAAAIACCAAVATAVLPAAATAVPATTVVPAGTRPYAKYYTVAANYQGAPEDLTEIAARFLGDGARSVDIYHLNSGRAQPDGSKLTDPEQLHPGWYLSMPWDALGAGLTYGQFPLKPPAPPTTRPAATPTRAARPIATARNAGPVRTPSPPAGPDSSQDTVIHDTLKYINAARTANGLAPLTYSAALSRATRAHNALLVAGCPPEQVHQCPGEADIGDRFHAAGVSWSSAVENVGQGGATDDQASIIKAADGLTDMMLAEQPPDDGHRRNLLNPDFTLIGLAVTRESDGTVWVTQDFVS